MYMQSATKIHIIHNSPWKKKYPSKIHIISHLQAIFHKTTRRRAARPGWRSSAAAACPAAQAAAPGAGSAGSPWDIDWDKMMIKTLVYFIGFRDNLQETPIFTGENYGFL
jgi:hypothetical protein